VAGVIAKVEPLTTARGLRGPFDYRLGEQHDDARIGSVLVVPFGRRRMLGVVVALAESSELPAERLAEPLALIDSGIPERLVDLGLWVAEQYVSTPARGLALVLAPGTGTGSRGPLRQRTSLVAELTGGVSPAAAGRLGGRQQAALQALRAGPKTATELVRHEAADHSTLRSLERRGLVRLERRAHAPRRPRIAAVGAAGSAFEPTPEQAVALAAVDRRLEARGGGGPLLLHGVTGSGKTEVYLRAVAATLQRGRSAMVLVPEIALTPQTAARFTERFGDAVALMHSRLTARQRYDEWARMRGGEARVCVGPRSAVFAPFDDLGLIVIDEEHDHSYKQEGDPRYDARLVAERRAELEGAVLLAGSATPRPESFMRYERLLLRERIDGRRLPPVELVGTAGLPGPLHQRTRDALDEVTDLLRVELGAVLAHHHREALDRGDRREELVRQDLDQLRLRPVQLLKLLRERLGALEQRGELVDDVRRDLDRQAPLAAHRTADRVQDLLGRRALDEVADDAGAQHVEHGPAVLVRREGDDLRLRRDLADLAGRARTASGRHLDVDERDLGMLDLGEADGLVGVAGRPDDLHPGIGCD
jgi:primosomal protein N'